MNHFSHSTVLFECYCWWNYTTISNTDYLSYFDLSYVLPGHNDSKEWGPTVSYNYREGLTYLLFVQSNILNYNMVHLPMRCQMDSDNFTSGYVNYLEVIFQNKWKKGIWKQQKHHQALSMFGYSTPLLWTLNREIS